MVMQNHTLNMFERDELLEIIECWYSRLDFANPKDTTLHDEHQEMLDILGCVDEGEDCYDDI